MLLQVLVKAQSMEELVNKCNLINLKGGHSFNFSPVVFDGKMFYCTYYIDTDQQEIIRKVSEIERRNTKSK